MVFKHTKARQPGAIRRLQTWSHLTAVNRDLSDRLAAATADLRQRDLAVIAIRDDGFAEGLAAGLGLQWAPPLPGPAERHLRAVPLRQEIRYPGVEERSEHLKRLHWARPAPGLPALHAHRGQPGPCLHLREA